MTPRAKRPVAPPEATQQLQALDVVELVRAPTAPLIRQRVPSHSSIAPVGLDLQRRPGKGAVADEETSSTLEVALPGRRRHLGVFVVGALSVCALILVAALVGRVIHGSAAPTQEVGRPSAAVAMSAAAITAQPGSPSFASFPPSLPSTASPLTSGAAASTGTVRLDRPAFPGRVWLDGKKLSSSSAMVSCGTHQIKVGAHRTHSIDVPCGGELGVSK